jgi:hypothetical protein
MSPSIYGWNPSKGTENQSSPSGRSSGRREQVKLQEAGLNFTAGTQSAQRKPDDFSQCTLRLCGEKHPSDILILSFLLCNDLRPSLHYSLPNRKAKTTNFTAA